MTTHNDKKAIVFGLGAVLMWSTVATAFKLTLGYMSVVSLVWWASVVSLLVLGLWVGITGRAEETKNTSRSAGKRLHCSCPDTFGPISSEKMTFE